MIDYNQIKWNKYGTMGTICFENGEGIAFVKSMCIKCNKKTIQNHDCYGEHDDDGEIVKFIHENECVECGNIEYIYEEFDEEFEYFFDFEENVAYC